MTQIKGTPKFVASHLRKTSHIGTSKHTHTNLYPLAGDDHRFTLLKRGCANSVVGLELAENFGMLLLGDAVGGGTVFVRFLHDGPMSLAICRLSPYCLANVMQDWYSLSQTRGVAFLWRYGAFLLTVDNFSFFSYSWSFFAYSFSFLTYSWSFSAYSGKVRLIRALRDCKQRS